MEVIALSELTVDDLEGFSFEVLGSTIVRFCLDVQHDMIILCEEREPHILGAEELIAKEENISELAEADIAKELLNHIVGGSLYLSDDPNVAEGTIGGSSL